MFTRFWIACCGLLAGGGWILSLFSGLNKGGYIVLFVLAGVAGVLWRTRGGGFSGWKGRCRHIGRWRVRFRRPLPLAFLVLTLLAVGGGVVHPPGNYDGLTYRTPRMLHWLEEGKWHWIHTHIDRQNNRAANFEWVAMPLLVFGGSDRLFFVPNAVSFVLLPGLIYGVFVRLGVRRRTAWSWMWVLPSGYGFILQAGGSSNDLFAAPFALAAVDFALRARQSGRFRDAGFSVLAAALMTGVKATNLTLLLPWAWALAPSWRLFFKKPSASAPVLLAAVLASFLPVAVLNQRHCGDWTGAALEPSVPQPAPLTALAGNAFLIPLGNVSPPFFPAAAWWNEHAFDLFPNRLRVILEHHFEQGAGKLGEMPVEDAAGIGFGVTMLLAVSLAAVWLRKNADGIRRIDGPASGGMAGLAVGTAALSWVSLLVFMLKTGLSLSARILTPYYPLLFPLLLLPAGHGPLVRRVWWRGCALAVCVLAGLILLANPARPLWPAQTVLARLDQWKPGCRIIQRARKVYSVYGQRADALAPIRRLIPPEAEQIGFVASKDDPETSLWRPFGSRRIVHVLSGDGADELRRKGIEYVVINSGALTSGGISDWLERYNAGIVQSVSLVYRASQAGPQVWFLVRLREESSPKM